MSTSASATLTGGVVKIDSIWVPYIQRLSKSQRYVAVKTVEILLLSRFPNMFLKELEDRGPLDSFGMSSEEAKFLNEISQKQCGLLHGLLKGDLLVKLDEFDSFYRIVQKHFMNLRTNVAVKPKKNTNNNTPTPNLTPTPTFTATPTTKDVVKTGWMQINNTIVPSITCNKVKFIPLSVIR